MRLDLSKDEKRDNIIYLLQLAQNFFNNSNPDVYRRIRDFIKNHEYDFETKKGVYLISTIDELKKDLQFYVNRKNNKELNLKIQYYFGIFMLIGLGVYAIREIID